MNAQDLQKYTQSRTAVQLTIAIRAEFESKHPDLFAMHRDTPTVIFERLTAAIMLDSTWRDKLEEKALAVNNAPDDGEAFVARQFYWAVMYAMLVKAYLRVYRNGAIRFVGALTEEAAQQLSLMEAEAGEKPLPAPAPKPLTAAQLLEREVLEDYNGVRDGRKFIKAPIRTDAIREKCRKNVAYRQMFDRLSNENRLESQVTTAYNAQEIGG